jgi:uncharacterized SAM-binding protein YcdF (DUF218 family)
MSGIIIVLGSPNDEQGNLSNIALSGIDKGIEEYFAHSDYKFLCTGGWGEHFNTTNKPHAYYVKQELLKRIPKQDILDEIVESSNTVEDARLSKPIVDSYGVTELIIVTADYHMGRTRYIFERVFPDYHLQFSEAEADISREEREKLVRHETEALARLAREDTPH